MKKILVLFVLSSVMITCSLKPVFFPLLQTFSLSFLPSSKKRKKVYAGAATVGLIACLTWYNRTALKGLAASGFGIPTLLKK